MYNSTTGELIRELRPNRHGGYSVMCLRYHPKDPNFLYAGTAEGHVYLINTETGELQHIITGKLESFSTSSRVRSSEGALAAHTLWA